MGAHRTDSLALNNNAWTNPLHIRLRGLQGDGRDRWLRRMSVPPNAPRIRIATAPPSSVSSEPSPPEEAREFAARSTTAGTGVPRSDELAPAVLWRAPCGIPRALALARPDPPEPGGLMPAPNGTFAEEPSWPAGPAPVCRAWFRGSAYCLDAGEPGSAWTPGSRPRAGTGTARQPMANAAKAPAV